MAGHCGGDELSVGGKLHHVGVVRPFWGGVHTQSVISIKTRSARLFERNAVQYVDGIVNFLCLLRTSR